MYSFLEQSVNSTIVDLKEKGNAIASNMAATNYFWTADEQVRRDIEDEMEQIAEDYVGRIVVADNNLKILNDTYRLEQGKTIISEQAIKAVKGSDSQYINRKKQYVELIIPVTPVEANTVKENEIVQEKEEVPNQIAATDGIIIMSFSIRSEYNTYRTVSKEFTLILAIFAVLIIIASFGYSVLITKPFRKVAAMIDQTTTEGLNEHIEMKGFYEIGQIAESFNRLFTRLQMLEDSRQEFVSNVSHELKTPITSMKVLAESLIMQEDAPVEMYRDFMVDISKEIERENKIITDLLSLVKMDKTAGDLNISSVNINELVEMILKRLRPIAESRNIELVFESFRPVEAEVDEVKLSIAINNLIENAIKYNFDDGWVRVSLNADHRFFYLTVSDSGVGIPEELQEHIFERFYRVDKARSRETGGTGLGLSITRNAVIMHRGAIKVHSREREGATFTIRIPLSYIAG